ncbi:MAG: hypothetical protein LBI04_06835 [Treponema sp.]|jgi:hypothetical protein|nr:hypothetical protein [Treponema sp.]
MSYSGVIIEESLHDKNVLKSVKIVSTRVEKVEAMHETPWLEKWTLHTIEIPENNVEKTANELAKSFDMEHIGNWYADFKNNEFHYFIFPNKIFKLDRRKKSDYDEMGEYALSIGLPKHQLIDFSGVDEMEKERAK